MRYIVKSIVRKNTRFYKPLEDYLISDAEHGIFVVTDGVTQSAEKYVPGMEQSEAGAVAEIAATAVHEALLSSAYPPEAIKTGVRTAIERVSIYNQTVTAPFPPAACMVAACVRDDILHFAYIGDSVIFLLRDSAKIQLAEQQTEPLATYQRLYGERFSKDVLYSTITNNIRNPLGYGVILGDIRAMDFLRIASIPLQPGDRIIVSSDGLDKYLLFTPVEDLRFLSPDAMLSRSACYDEPPYASYADDKAMIIIDVSE